MNVAISIRKNESGWSFSSSACGPLQLQRQTENIDISRLCIRRKTMRRIRTGIILIRGRWLTHRRIWITGRSRRSRAASSAASAGTATFAGISAAARIFSRIAIVIRIGRKRRFDLFLRISRRPYRGSRRRRRRRIRIRNNCDQSGTAGHPSACT